MRIKEGFILRTICGEHVVVGEGLAQVNFNKMLALNASAAYLWESLAGKEFCLDDMMSLLTEKYEVDAGKAAEDAAKLLDIWVKEGVVEA